MRFSTADCADCWMKRVVSFWPMLNCCQLMMALGELVTVRVFPAVAKVALPAATLGPTGLASAGWVKAAATARHNTFFLNVASRAEIVFMLCMTGLRGIR